MTGVQTCALPISVPCILIMPSRANADSPVELRLQEEGKGTYLSEYANFAAALTEGKILLLADLRGFGETTDPAFYTDAKYWNREYRNAMVSMHIGRPIMGQRVVDILTLLDFCSEHEFLKGHPVKVFADRKSTRLNSSHSTSSRMPSSA